jgi:YVTN family beta-propeller protein
MPIRISPDGSRLFAVNTPDGRLSVFDVTQGSSPRLLAEIPVGIEPVSVNPRTSDEAWVINEVSDSISIVSVSLGIVTDTLAVKDEPADVVFAGGRAFVSAARKNALAVFDVATHAFITNIVLFGENPRALAVNTNGTKVFAAFALSGNHTTIVPANNAPPQSAPTNPKLPAPPQVGLIVDATNAAWFPSLIKYTMPDNDVVQIDAGTLGVDRYFSGVGTVNLGLAVRPGSGDLYVANTQARNLVHFEPVLSSHTVDNRITRIAGGSGLVMPFELNSGIDYNVLPNAAAKTNALAQPTAIVFDPAGAFLYVAAFGSDRVARLDADDPSSVLARIELCPTAPGSAADPRNKRGPRGLALNAPADRLYVLNRLANTVSIIDTTTDSLLKEIPVGSYDPTPSVVRQGRGFLYDAKLSGNGTMACAACHIDAEMDLIAWDLGDPGGEPVTNVTILPPFNLTNVSVFHPMKGPMTTQTLRGLKGLDPLHWRGDRTNFTHFNIAFPSLMGSPALSTTDMAAYRDFINTIVFQPNPNQNLDRTYPTNFAGGNAEAGRLAFFFTNYTGSGATGLKCTSCHTGPPGTGSDSLIIPAAALQESQDFKVPHLREIYQKVSFSNVAGTNTIGGFGLVHDGTDPTLQVFLSRAVFTNIRNDTSIKNNLAAFVLAFDTGIAPAVGYTRTVTSANVSTAAVTNDWSLLQAQAALTNLDLVARGTLDGARHGLWYQPLTGTYLPDSTNLPSFTRSQLIARIQNGDTLTFVGVPPGTGRRLGIDRDMDGVLDADASSPVLQVSHHGGAAVFRWPYSAPGYGLEATTNLAENTWTRVPDPVEILGGENFVTNAVSGPAMFYRLKYPWP